MRRNDEILQRLESLEATVASQVKVHLEVQQHIAAIHGAIQGLTQKTFVQSQQLSITHRKVEEAETRIATSEELTGVLEREANDLRVDANAHRAAVDGLSQQINYLFTVLERIGAVLGGSLVKDRPE